MQVSAIFRAAISTVAVVLVSTTATVFAVTIETAPADFEARYRVVPSSGATSYDPRSANRNSDTNDHLWVGYATNYGAQNYAAGATPNGAGSTAVFYFQLPVLGTGQAITSASFSTALVPDSATISSQVTPRFNADLYALGVVRDLPSTGDAYTSTSQSYYYIGENDPTAAGEGGALRTKIQNNFFTPYTDYQDVNNPGGGGVKGNAIQHSTDDAGSANLLAYVNSLYASSGFVNDGNSYLVLRMNPDNPAGAAGKEGFEGQTVGTGASRYALASSESNYLLADGTVAGTYLNLEVTAVPEPSTVAMLGIGAVALVGYRYRRSRKK